MDHLSHSLPRQSQTTHHQPHFHRRSRSSTFRIEGRLPRRILRWSAAHRPSSDLRGCLCSPARGEYSRARQHSAEARYLGTARHTASAPIVKGGRDPQPSPAPSTPHPQIAATLPRPPLPGSRPPLPVVSRAPEAFSTSPDRAGRYLGNLGKSPESSHRPQPVRCPESSHRRQPVRPPESSYCPQRLQHRGRAALQRRVSHPELMWALAPEVSSRFCLSVPLVANPASRAQAKINRPFMRCHFLPRLPQNPKTTPFQPLPHNCGRPVNRSCGKQIHQPRTKPVIVEDTTYGVSLLTGTISGSNLAIQ